MSTSEVLPQGAGYGVVIGIGLFFSAFMVGLTAMQSRYTGVSPTESEEFSSASRSVKPGLIASGIVSAWTWAATLLQSSAVAYRYGISGPWWYAAGATVQVLLFAQLAAKLKLNAPYAHTWLEIVAARWGTTAHLFFMFFGLATNLIVSSMLVLGGSATVTSLTGMSTIAACFLIPLGVAMNAFHTALTHTTVLFAIILTFMFTVYATSGYIGSISRMHYLLGEVSKISPVAGNAGGSYLTLRSKNGLIFGVINLVGNFATVFEDQAYWQRAIASRPSTTVKAYLIGGLAWFAVPFAFSTTLGLAAVAFSAVPAANSPSQDPLSSNFIPMLAPLSQNAISEGLPASLAAATLLGKSGAAALLIVLFLAVTSATSAELIAVSSILTYDVYVRYINPKATEQQILRMSHAGVAIFALVMGIAGVIFYYIGVSMGWLYTFMGVILGSAVCPIALCITWKKANKVGCILGSLIGFSAGIIAWLVTTSALNQKVINVTTSGGDYEMLAGNLASIGVGAIISTTTSLIWPDDYDFASARAINNRGAAVASRNIDDELEEPEVEKKGLDMSALSATNETELDPVGLNKAFKFAARASIVLTLVLIILIPLPLFFAQTIYSVTGFSVWVIVGIIWTFLSAVAVVIYPLWESRAALRLISRGVIMDIFSPGSGKFVAPSSMKKPVE
ncbi:urea transporter [Suillus fuscotomentosus]|uniref:Urea transporter n=1 Tax=Suillus fuscotomentosus TaxID=1912939 RepID=A0AAD4DWR5_9AGAM|nr:urea transporter [Suillus fuscotomentosus]KAG1895432.1 urea transporter [Suillus fuscotomentosus]